MTDRYLSEETLQYIEQLSADAKEHDGKIHCTFSLCATATGRLASNNPRCWAHVA